MKKLLAIISFPVMILACSQAPSYTIEASIEGLSDGKVYLKQRGASGWDTVDSTQATGGKFTFNGAVTTPEQYVIMGGRQCIGPAARRAKPGRAVCQAWRKQRE